MKWSEFKSWFIFPYWYDEAARPKTTRALKVVAAKLPRKAMKDLNMVIFAPGMYQAGAAWQGEDRLYIWFDTNLERDRQSVVNFFVAHELAHVVLGHPNQTKPDETEIESWMREIEADAYAANLGFRRPKTFKK